MNTGTEVAGGGPVVVEVDVGSSLVLVGTSAVVLVDGDVVVVDEDVVIAVVVSSPLLVDIVAVAASLLLASTPAESLFSP
jgi:hypothetical protein